MKINQIRPQEAKFTEVLEGIALTPKMLYYYGFWPEFRQKRPKTVAIVGARKHTKYGEEAAYRAAFELAKRGVVIVSGLAIGIDSVAHRAALDAGGTTIAVLGTEINRIYPARHTGLAEEIVKKGGAVVSEYGPGNAPQGAEAKTRFLQRNRLISGLADAVIVAEANERSGTLNTAAHAIEQGRDLWVVPGDINRPTSRGCNRLLFQGANPYTGSEDLIQALGLSRAERRNLNGDNATETAILKLLATGVREGEEVVGKLALQAGEFNRTMTLLEIKGRVRALGANQWVLT